MERRFLTTELRMVDAGDVRQIEGYAALYSQPSVTLMDAAGRRFVEMITPGAFDGVVGQDVRALLNHNPEKVLGRTTAGTLALQADERGLWFSATLPETSYARDLAESLRRGDIDQMSFAFEVAGDGQRWDWQTDPPTRWLLRFRSLLDVSPVTYAAYPQTDVALRAMMNIPEVPVDARGATALAVEIERQRLQAQAAHRRRKLVILGG